MLKGGFRRAAVFFVSASLAAQPVDRAARWRDDLAGFSHALKSGQYAFAKRTFSAAIENAMEMKAKLHATLVGEPTGGKPNIYGNPKTLTLSNSQLRVQYSTSFVHHVSGADPSWVEPDVRVTPTLAEVLAGHDPVLEVAVTRVSGR